MDEKKSMHFIMLNDSKSEILGVCNYTKIKDGACWLGYSISSKYEGMGIMYNAVEQSTSFQAYQKKEEEMPKEYTEIYEECMKYYQQLFEQRIH